MARSKIPVRSLYDAGTKALFQRYYRLFANADLVFATTSLVAGHLREHLQSEGLPVPAIRVIPLPAQFANLPRVRETPTLRRRGDPLRLLTVATWEPRKNLLRLLHAVRLAQERSEAAIHLTLVGRRMGHVEHDAEVDALLAATPGVTAHNRTGDRELAALYAGCHASVYPSYDEGFGMPVLESLWLGRPCLCHAGSAMTEVAPGGGTMMTDMTDEAVIAAALVQLAAQPRLLDRFAREALARPLRTWHAYAADLVDHLKQA